MIAIFDSIRHYLEAEITQFVFIVESILQSLSFTTARRLSIGLTYDIFISLKYFIV